MVLVPSDMWLILSAILIISILALLFSYLQVHQGILIRPPFAPQRKLTHHIRRKQTPLTKIWIAIRWLYVQYIHPSIRVLFVHPEMSLTILSILPAIGLMAYWIEFSIGFEPLILVTLFYASILFFKEIFLTDFPLSEISRTLHTNQDRDLKVTFEVSNIGSKPITNLLLYYRVYDANGGLLKRKSTPLGYRKQMPLSLDPGETSAEFRVPLEKAIGFESRFDEWNVIEDNTPTPIFIELGAAPNIGHRFLGDREMIRFDPDLWNSRAREAWEEF